MAAEEKTTFSALLAAALGQSAKCETQYVSMTNLRACATFQTNPFSSLGKDASETDRQHT